MRPLVAEFPDDPAASELTYEWLDGPSILAAPVVYESGNYSTYLPTGLWMEYNTTASHQGPVTLQGDSSPLLSVPMFMRVPSIVPITPLVQHTGELPGGPLEVHVYSSSGAEDEDDGTTTFTVYEDDGETTDYLTRPSTTSREIAFAWAADKLTLTWVVPPLPMQSSGPSQLPLPLSFTARSGLSTVAAAMAVRMTTKCSAVMTTTSCSAAVVTILSKANPGTTRFEGSQAMTLSRAGGATTRSTAETALTVSTCQAMSTSH